MSPQARAKLPPELGRLTRKDMDTLSLVNRKVYDSMLRKIKSM